MGVYFRDPAGDGSSGTTEIMYLDYDSPKRSRTREEPGRLARWLMKPVGWPAWLIYLPIWSYGLCDCRLPPVWEDDTSIRAFAAFALSIPLMARILVVMVLRVVYERQVEPLSPFRRRATQLIGCLSLLVPLLVAVRAPLAIGFIMSYAAMNRIHSWALAHPGGHLPDQRIGVYWAEDITATKTGVSFRVCGWPGLYGSRSGFASGGCLPDGTGEPQVTMSDPLWQAWGWDY
jgi:hypothetical protein